MQRHRSTSGSPFLGVTYRSGGQGMSRDDAQAMVVGPRSAAEQGNAVAQNSLGAMYHSGHGVPQDYAQAAYWYGKAADQGNANAQYNLGSLYYLGRGVPQDYAQAYFWALAASGRIEALKQGDVDELRDEAASYLTPAEVSKREKSHSAKTER
jgi:hypothetical protein